MQENRARLPFAHNGRWTNIGLGLAFLSTSSPALACRTTYLTTYYNFCCLPRFIFKGMILLTFGGMRIMKIILFCVFLLVGMAGAQTNLSSDESRLVTLLNPYRSMASLPQFRLYPHLGES